VRALSIRLVMLAAPFALVYAFAGYVLFASGELERIDDVVAVQHGRAREVLFGTAYSDHTAYYKLRAVLTRRPAVLVLGSSRVMTIRSALFRTDLPFYNAGGPLPRVALFADFLRRVPLGDEPRLIVVGLDHWLFSAGWPRSIDTMPDLSKGGPERFKVVGNSVQKVVTDYLLGKYTLAQLAQPHEDTLLIGMNAVVNRFGFRNDGSHRITGPADPRLQNQIHEETLRDIAAGIRLFAPAASVSPEAVEDLRQFLRQCRARNIHVVGFLPPFTHRFHTALLANGRYSYLLELVPKLSPVFSEAGFAFFDFSDLAVVGASDAEAFDTFHVSEKAYLRIFLQMAAQERSLREALADVGELKARLAASRSDAYVFGD
jgi:hypothetical protein